MDNAYVYIYKDDTGVPRYVGKGRGSRITDHITLATAHNEGRRLERATHFTRWLAKCIRLGKVFSYEIHTNNLSDDAAFKLEAELIARLGRSRKGGTLYNTTAGGDGFTSEDAKEIAARPDVKRKKQEALERNLADPKFRAKLSQATKESNGRPHRREQAREKATAEWKKEERRAAAAQRARELWADPAWSAKRRKELEERNRSEGSKAKSSEIAKRLWADPAFRSKVSEAITKMNARRRAK